MRTAFTFANHKAAAERAWSLSCRSPSRTAPRRSARDVAEPPAISRSFSQHLRNIGADYQPERPHRILNFNLMVAADREPTSASRIGVLVNRGASHAEHLGKNRFRSALGPGHPC